jgi:hypothetical protein
MDLLQRRAELARLIDCVFVFRGTDHHERIFLCARGDGPVDLPERYGKGPIRPFDPSQCRRTQTRAATKPHRPSWTVARIRNELAAYLADASIMPNADQFMAHGRSKLYEQILTRGGTRHWAKLAGVGHPRDRNGIDRWTDERIRGALATLLPGRSIWHTHREFTEAGYEGLYTAIRAREGHIRWADEFGLIYRYRSTNRYWTDQRIEDKLRAFTAEHTCYPPIREFKEANLTPLETAIRKTRGHKWWAHHLELPRPRNQYR